MIRAWRWVMDWLERLFGDPEDAARWEAVADEDGGMWRVRWSAADQQRRYLWVAHYPGSAWGRHCAERTAERLNAEGRTPVYYGHLMPRTAAEALGRRKAEEDHE